MYVYVCLYVCMCMYVCMQACMYVCMNEGNLVSVTLHTLQI